jgi:hypothetical protein
MVHVGNATLQQLLINILSPDFPGDEQRASLGVLLMILKCEIRPLTILINKVKPYLLLVYLYN